MHSVLFLAGCVMAELPSGLLEACVVVGASSDKLRDAYQVYIFIYTLQIRKASRQMFPNVKMSWISVLQPTV